MLRRILLCVTLLPFIAIAQLWLSVPAPLGPNRGELGVPFGAVVTLAAGWLLVQATKSERFSTHRKVALPVMGAMWLCLVWMLGIALFSTPWTLVSVPVWLNPSELHYMPRPALWLPFHLFHAAGPVCLALALSASAPRERAIVFLGGVVPWVLATLGYMYLSQAAPTSYAG